MREKTSGHDTRTENPGCPTAGGDPEIAIAAPVHRTSQTPAESMKLSAVHANTRSKESRNWVMVGSFRFDC